MITIEVCEEQINSIIIKELSKELRYLKYDLKEGTIAISFDYEKHKKKVKRLAKAIELVIDYYGEEE